jgi:hypothetical protein
MRNEFDIKSDRKIDKLKRDLAIVVTDRGIVNDGTTSIVDKMNVLLSEIGSGNADIYFPLGSYLFDDDVTFPSNVNLIFANGAKLVGDAGTETVTINGGIDAGLWWIFDNLVVEGSSKIECVYPEWFGINGDGTNENVALQKVFDFFTTAKTTLFIRENLTIACDNIVITDKSDFNIKCDGVLKRVDSPSSISNILTFTNCTNVHIPNIRFDSNGLNNGCDEDNDYTTQQEYSHCIRLHEGCGNIYIDNISSIETSGDVIYMRGISDIHIGTIKSVCTTRIGRNVVSIINGSDIYIDNIIGRNHGHYSMPGGFDIEPNLVTESVNNVFVNNIDVVSGGTNPISVLDTNDSVIENIFLGKCYIKSVANVGTQSSLAYLCGTNVTVESLVIEGLTTKTGLSIATFSTISDSTNNINVKYCYINTIGNAVNIGFDSNTKNIKLNLIVNSASSSGCRIGNVDNLDLKVDIRSVGASSFFIQKLDLTQSDNVRISGTLKKVGTGLKAIIANTATSLLTNWVIDNVDFTGWGNDQKLFGGGLQSSVRKNNCTNLNFASSAPTFDNWVVGDIVYNTSPIASGSIGWVCVATGNPGTWKGFGLIET